MFDFTATTFTKLIIKLIYRNYDRNPIVKSRNPTVFSNDHSRKRTLYIISMIIISQNNYSFHGRSFVIYHLFF